MLIVHLSAVGNLSKCHCFHMTFSPQLSGFHLSDKCQVIELNSWLPGICCKHEDWFISDISSMTKKRKGSSLCWPEEWKLIDVIVSMDSSGNGFGYWGSMNSCTKFNNYSIFYFSPRKTPWNTVSNAGKNSRSYILKTAYIMEIYIQEDCIKKMYMPKNKIHIFKKEVPWPFILLTFVQIMGR